MTFIKSRKVKWSHFAGSIPPSVGVLSGGGSVAKRDRGWGPHDTGWLAGEKVAGQPGRPYRALDGTAPSRVGPLRYGLIRQLSMDPNRYAVSEPELLRTLRLSGQGGFL